MITAPIFSLKNFKVVARISTVVFYKNIAARKVSRLVKYMTGEVVEASIKKSSS